MSRDKQGREKDPNRYPDFVKGGAKQIVLKCVKCGMEDVVWEHNLKRHKMRCTFTFGHQLLCGGRMMRK